MVFDESHDRRRSPDLDRVQIDIEITRPGSTISAIALLAGAKGDAKAAVSNRQDVNAEGVCDAGPGQLSSFFSCDSPEVHSDAASIETVWLQGVARKPSTFFRESKPGAVWHGIPARWNW